MTARALALLAVLAAGIAAVLVATGEERHTRYRIVFDNAFGVVDGAEFKVAGVHAGKVTRFDLTGGTPPKALVEVTVEEAGLPAFRADASCEIRPQSLIGEYFVDCQPGASPRPLPNETVSVERTAGTIPLDLVNDILREPQRERLPLILNALGAGLAGRPHDVREVLLRAHPGLRETDRTLRILARQRRVIDRFIADAETVLSRLAERKRDVRRFVRAAARTAKVSASRREDITRSLERLPTFLDELSPTMARLGALADAQLPVLRDLRRAAPELDRSFRDLQPFAEEARPALLELGDLSRTGTAAVRATGADIRELRALARSAPGLAKPLRQLLQTIDDRDRAIEPDPRAAETAPPAPDKTAEAEGKGFTGMEALLNYVFWQTLSINGFDQISHVLRFTATIDDCSPYQSNPSRALTEGCASWLGPYQPGVTAPDPTAGYGAPTERRERRTRGSRRSGGGSPQVPGDGAPPPAPRSGDQVPPAARDAPGGSRQLLDFLLGS